MEKKEVRRGELEMECAVAHYPRAHSQRVRDFTFTFSPPSNTFGISSDYVKAKNSNKQGQQACTVAHHPPAHVPKIVVSYPSWSTPFQIRHSSSLRQYRKFKKLRSTTMCGGSSPTSTCPENCSPRFYLVNSVPSLRYSS